MIKMTKKRAIKWALTLLVELITKYLVDKYLPCLENPQSSLWKDLLTLLLNEILTTLLDNVLQAVHDMIIRTSVKHYLPCVSSERACAESTDAIVV